MVLKHKTFTNLNDVFTVGDNDSYYLNFMNGNDRLTVNGSGTGHTFIMGDGSDSVTLNASAVTSSATRANVYLGQGNDNIAIFSSQNRVFGGNGDDTISLSFKDTYQRGNTIDAGTGNDIVNIEASRDNLVHGGTGDDTFNIGGGASGLFLGDAGDDVFHITGFADSRDVRGGEGNDSYYMDDNFPSASLVREENSEGFDTLYVRSDKESSVTLPDNVEKLVTIYSDKFGINEDLTLIGNNGGNHIVAAGWGSHINGKGGDDLLEGTNYVDKIQGGEGSDTIFGYDGDDVIYGDYDYQGPGVGGGDVINGGMGNDTIDGGVGDDELKGEGGDDHIVGGIGNDKLIGGSGNDHLAGDNGDDIMNGGDGADIMEGGGGSDIYEVNHAGDKVIEANTTGVDTVYAERMSYTLTENVENLVLGRTYPSMYGNVNGTGNASNNSITGSQGNNVLSGLDGNDILLGLNGHDFLYGGNGNDRIEGGYGNDQLFGGAHNDTLLGGDGTDVLYGEMGGDILTGGAGADSFVFTSVADSFGNGAFADSITDFTAKTDKLNLYLIDADTTQAGNQAFTYAGGIKPLFSSAGDLWTQKFNGGVNLYGDVDGDGTADFHVTLNSMAELYASDLIL